MARRRVADGGDGLQMRKVAVNMLNKQSRTAGKESSSSLGFGRGYGNEPSGFMKYWEILEYLSDWELLNSD
jgi:hypothetical protein